MPAFVVPFFFVLDPLGTGILLNLPKGSTWPAASWVILLCFFAIAALAAGLQGWLFSRLNAFERTLLIAGGLLLVTPLVRIGFGGWTLPMHADYVGIGLIAIGSLLNVARLRALAPA
jgi:TRAP-type uncharacterized transport system fused permease subunit